MIQDTISKDGQTLFLMESGCWFKARRGPYKEQETIVGVTGDCFRSNLFVFCPYVLLTIILGISLLFIAYKDQYDWLIDWLSFVTGWYKMYQMLRGSEPWKLGKIIILDFIDILLKTFTTLFFFYFPDYDIEDIFVLLFTPSNCIVLFLCFAVILLFRLLSLIFSLAWL